MRAGGLRHVLHFQSEVSGLQDKTGAVVSDWVPYYRCRGRIASSRGREFEAAKQSNADLTHLLIVRYSDKLALHELHKHRIEMDCGNSPKRYFEILSVVDIMERHREFHINCNELILK